MAFLRKRLGDGRNGPVVFNPSAAPVLLWMDGETLGDAECIVKEFLDREAGMVRPPGEGSGSAAGGGAGRGAGGASACAQLSPPPWRLENGSRADLSFFRVDRTHCTAAGRGGVHSGAGPAGAAR